MAGCATQTNALLARSDSPFPEQIELTNTPFFAQESFQCGPAALAMVMGAAGLHIEPEALTPEVYLPARQGSLQIEMLAAARKHDVLAFTLPPKLEAVLSEVAAGHPVLVLQNLGLSWMPRWHYAVVTGFDLNKREILMRSGPEKRLRMPIRTFEYTWARSQYWAIAILAPGKLPVSTDAASVIAAMVAYEKNADPEKANLAYARALKSWPNSLSLLMGSGNSAYAAGHMQDAESAFRAATASHPGSAAALNNLATVLMAQQKLQEALIIARQSAAIEGQWQQQSLATLQAIEIALQANAEPNRHRQEKLVPQNSLRSH